MVLNDDLMGGARRGKGGWLSILLLDDEGTHVVPSDLVVLGMGTITVGELLGPPAATVDGLAANVFYVEAVHHLGTVLTHTGVDLAFLTSSEVPANQEAT